MTTLRLIAFAALALAVTTSAEAMSPGRHAHASPSGMWCGDEVE
jgi:hypothetical protein